MKKALNLNQKRLKETAKLVGGFLGGFLASWLISHPHKSPVYRKIPEKKIRNISVLPNLKIHRQDKHYHFHHWMHLSAFYLLILSLRRNLIKSKFLHGVFLGGILQGLTYKDRFHVVHKSNNQK